MPSITLLKEASPNSQWLSSYNAPKWGTSKLKTALGQKILQVSKHYFLATYELFLGMLCTELDLDPKIKAVTLVKYYDFYLGHIPMQIF